MQAKRGYNPDSTGIFALDEEDVAKIHRKRDAVGNAFIDIGQRIRAARKIMGLDTAAAAKLTGKTPKEFLALEMGAVDMDYRDARHLADKLSVSACFLLSGAEIPTKRQIDMLQMADVWAGKKPLPVSELLPHL